MSDGDPDPDFVLLIVIFAGLAMIVLSVIGLLYVASSVTTR
jgi:hypothetical protein